MTILLERDKTSIIEILKNEFDKDIFLNDEKTTKLKEHQYRIKTFFKTMQYNDAYGLLLYHKMGTGKTILSISIAHELEENTVVFINGGLINSYKSDIKKYLNMIGFVGIDHNDYILNKFQFVSLNAFNLKDKIPDLENKFIVIDEAHHLFSSIINGSSNGLKLYTDIRNAVKKKVLLMTGTPILNDPYEVMIGLNLLTKHLIIPESYEEFITNFTDKKIENEEIYNYRMKKMENRIFGLSSFYEQPVNEYFPADNGTKIIKAPMTIEQKERYYHYKKIEDNAKFKSKNRIRDTGLAKSNKMASYKVKTRMLCNYDGIMNINDCIKFKEIHKKMLLHNGPSLIYSQFINIYGLEGFSKYLKNNGYVEYSVKKNTVNEDKVKTYSIIKGDVDFDLRTSIQEVFNSKENMYGEIINALLISSTGAEGLDLKFIRSVHIMEPYWNYSRIDQIKNRAIRYLSHELLPKHHKNVSTYIYISFIEASKELTTDEHMYKLSMDKEQYNNEFLHLIKRTAVDCIFNYNDCLKCTNNSIVSKLFTFDFTTDMNLPNECDTSDVVKKKITLVKDNLYYDETNKKYYKLIKGRYVEVKKN